MKNKIKEIEDALDKIILNLKVLERRIKKLEDENN